MTENRFVVIIPSYNNKSWCSQNILSVLNQNYSNYRIIYTDDCSTDNTSDKILSTIKNHNKKDLVTLIKNDVRLGATYNKYNMIQRCDDDEIVMILDGDDWFANSNVINRVNEEYNKRNIWITYGQYQSYPDNRIGCSREIPKNVISSNSFRTYRWCSSHLRTYYSWLFKLINIEDLKHEGKWLEMTGDLAEMFPMLEMAGEHQSFISDIVYIYNYTSPINDAKVNINLQQNLERKIRSMKPYSKLGDNYFNKKVL